MSCTWTQADAPGVLDLTSALRLSAPPAAAGEAPWWSAMIGITGVSVAQFASDSHGVFGDELLIADDFRPEELDEIGEGLLMTVFGQAPVLSSLNDAANMMGVTSFKLGAVVSETSLNRAAYGGVSASEPAPITVSDGTVVMAVIDEGIAFANNLFRSGLVRTRIEHMLILEASCGRDPEGPVSGRAFGKAEIDALLEQNTSAGLLNEAAFYRDTGLILHNDQAFSAAAQRRSHGTHVMALAAGYEIEDAPEDRPIIAVQLPSRVTNDTSGATLIPYLRHAFKTILKQARRFRLAGSGKAAPVVINFSFGNFGGPHDGTGEVSALIDREIEAHPDQTIRVLLPAGNGNITQTHACIGLSGDDPKRQVLDLLVLPDDRTKSQVEIWMPEAGETPPDFVTVTVKPPCCPASAPLHARRGERQVLLNDRDEVIAQLFYEFEAAPTRRGVIRLITEPTARLEGGTALAPSGQWQIKLKRRGKHEGKTAEIWIRRDETLPGRRPHGRQAYFNNADYLKFNRYGWPLAVDPPDSDSPIRRAGTLSGFACGEYPIVVAGFTETNLILKEDPCDHKVVTKPNPLLSDYSAAGPITPRPGPPPTVTRAGPDLSARSDQSPALPGVISAGSASGSFVRMNGTSVSAPLVARTVADALACGAAGDRNWACRAAEESEEHLQPPAPAKTRSGCGRLTLPHPFASDRVDS